MTLVEVLRTALLLAVCATVCTGHGLYPEYCSPAADLHEMKFLKGDTTEEYDSDGGVSKLSFRFLPRVTTSNNITGYFIELDTRMEFPFKGISENENITNDPIRLCVGLGSLHFIRQKDRQTAFDPAEVEGLFETNHKGLKFFENFKEFELKARFTPSIAVGHVLLNKTCWEEERKYSPCVLSLQVEERMKTAFSRKNPFSEEFWESMRGYFHQYLGAKLERLHMAFPYDHNNVLFRWLMWMLDQEHVDIYDFRMSSSEYNPNWGPLNDSWVQIMPLLTRLDLSNNGITEIQPDYLTTVATNLTFLNLGRNKLSTIPPQIYNLTKLTFLDLSRNPFQNLESFFEPRHLKNFPLVNFFNMSHVPIRDINLIIPMLRNTKTGLKPMQLTVLDLSSCDFKEFYKHPDLFSEQNNMTHLFLAGNRMGYSPKLNFPRRHQLMTIDLTFNNLTTPLHILDQGTVTNMNLSLNNITDWTNYYPDHPYQNISVFGNIDNLNLSLNTIPALTVVMGESLEELKTVDLGDNPIDCENCTIPQFKQWLKSYQANNNPNKVTIKMFNDTVNDFLCTRPLKLKTSLVSNITFDEEALCRKDERNLFVLLGIPLAAISSLVILLGIILYAYRYEATYLLHLVKIKRRMKSSATRAEGDYKYDGFVCYSGSDRAWVVGELLPTLENGPEKYRLCLHERDFMLGTFITTNIVGAMQTSRNTIVVLTDNFVMSQWCKWELEMANHKLFEESREFLVLIELERLDRSTLPRHLKYLMDTRTYLEWPEPEDRTGEVEVVYKRLKEALGPSIYEMEQEQAQTQYGEQPNNQSIVLRETTA